MNKSLRVRAVLVDDHPVVLAGLKSVLERAAVAVVAAGTTGAEALRLVADHRPDVLVLDLHLPDMNGLEVLRRLRHLGYPVAVLVLTAARDETLMLTLLREGAQGYVLKDEALEVLPHAVRAVAQGETWLSPSVATQVVRRLRAEAAAPSSPPSSGPVPPLTRREAEVLRLLAQGLDNAAIAARLVITKRTVQNHISAIYAKLGVRSRTEAMRLAIERGWVSLGES